MNVKSRRSGWNERLGPVEGFMFDLDGTLILSDRSLGGYRLLPGAVEVLRDLQSRGIPFVVLTNGTAYPVAEQAPKLRALGLPISDEAEMVEAILKDKKKILPCAAYLEGEYGIHGLFVGVPVKLGARGIEQIYQIKLTADEQAMLKKSADAVKELVDVIKSKM